MPLTRHLPAATRTHLHNIVVNHANPASQAFNQDPAGEGGAVTTKFAWDATLPPGGAHAGRYRLLRRTKNYPPAAGGQKTTWYKATHVGENSYTFEKITIPKCGICHGTGDLVCTACRGALAIGGPRELRVPCVLCVPPGAAGGAPTGVIRCARCNPAGLLRYVVDGASVDPLIANWL